MIANKSYTYVLTRFRIWPTSESGRPISESWNGSTHFRIVVRDDQHTRLYHFIMCDNTINNMNIRIEFIDSINPSIT